MSIECLIYCQVTDTAWPIFFENTSFFLNIAVHFNL